ncbi:glycosyltransferase family 2 protein [Candidatus Bathyarchaeota archaeon]|nr:glycosyltransferase family 2 protein [Candidatus Bathyarchaeota archaeon]
MYDVTIVLPVYCKTEQSLQWLDECLESACNQNCSVVVYDDGSVVSVDGIINKYPVTKFVKGSRNVGVSYARNRAISHSTTSLILPLDCDDRIVDGAVEKLYSVWNGIPVYPDIKKFGIEDIPHYALLNFDCSHIINFVGFTSVNVLHLKSQWRDIGGYDESVDFYEDGEYNARLLGNYCGVRYPEPLIEYRIHSDQRTAHYNSRAKEYALKLLDKIRRYNMPCKSCGGSRYSEMVGRSSPEKVQRGDPVTVRLDQSQENVTLPLEFEGKVLVQYAGGEGKGRHYYNGPATRTPYKVQAGSYMYVDQSDTSEANNTSLFNKVKRHGQTPTEQVAPRPVVEQKVDEPKVAEEVVVSRSPRKSADKAPVIDELPNISVMSWKEIQNLDMTPEVAKKLLSFEEGGRNRSKVMNLLKAKL